MEHFRIATPADIAHIETTPIEERLTAFNTYDMIQQGARINPEAPAISLILSGDQYKTPLQVNFRDLTAYINRTANLFNDLGIGPRDVISYLLPNLPHTHYVLWGGEAAGIANPINPMLEPATICKICRAAGTKVLVALGEVPGADIWDKVMAIRKDLPDLKAIVRVFGPSDEKNNIIGYDEVIGGYAADKLNSGRAIDPADTASIYHTGGTTGTPKLAPHTHFNEVAMTAMMRMAGDLHTGETVLCGLPLFHVNGTTVTGAVPFSIGAHTVLLSPRGYRDLDVMTNFFKIVEHYRAVSFSAVPTVLSVLLDVPRADADISSLRYAICGAAPLSVELIERFEGKTGMKILEGYGLTEGTTASSSNPFGGRRKTGSIGLRLPYQQMQVMVNQGDGAREAATDEIGAICIKGPNVFNGYLEESQNAGIWLRDDWFDTGDLGRQDADGYFWLTGRAKELIIRGGHNIDPATIEDPLYRLPDVQIAAAVGRPDAHAGEVPVVFVQLIEGSPLTPDDLLDYLSQNIGERAAIPKEVVILKDLPLTPVGKIYKPALRRKTIQRVYRRELARLDDMAAVAVDVSDDKVYGNLAVIRITPSPGVSADVVRQRVADILARYTVRYRLEIDAGPDR